MTVDVLWRRGENSPTQLARLELAATYEASFEVQPAAVLATDGAPGQSVPFEVRWRALRPVQIGEAARLQPARELVDTSLRTERDAGGTITLCVTGNVLPSSPWSRVTEATLRIEGVEPAPPEVPVHVTYQPLLRREPEGILQLHDDSTTGDATAEFRVRCAPELDGHPIHGWRIEPEAEQDVIAVESSTVGDRGVQVTLRARFGPQRSYAMGSLVPVSEHPAIEQSSVRWMYLRPRVDTGVAVK
jgi:hypothetical protein